MKRPNITQLQLQCDRFNEFNLIGTPVTVELDSGEIRTTKTRSGAEVLSGHSAVIWLVGIAGCYLLDRVKPAPASEVSA